MLTAYHYEILYQLLQSVRNKSKKTAKLFIKPFALKNEFYKKHEF